MNSFRLAVRLLLLALVCGFAQGGDKHLNGVFDLEGNSILSLPVDDTPLVLVFMSVECPIANRYAPTLRKLVESNKNARFVLVYPHVDEDAAKVRGHLLEYRLPLEAWRDTTKALAKSAGATITPEAVVFVKGSMVYRGRMDKRFADWGKQRLSASKHDLQEVLDAIAAGKKLEMRTTQAVGCYIGSVDE